MYILIYNIDLKPTPGVGFNLIYVYVYTDILIDLKPAPGEGFNLIYVYVYSEI